MPASNVKNPRKPPSPSMRVFCAAINRLGRRTGTDWRDVTPRMIETWTGEELLTSPQRPGRGQGRGRAAIYDARLVLEALDVALLMRRHFADDVALIRYARGCDFEPERVRRAYLNGIERWREEIEDAAAAGLAAFNAHHSNDPVTTDVQRPTDPGEIAEWSEPVLARRMIEHPGSREIRRLLTGAGQQPRATIEGLAGEFAATFLGGARSTEEGMLNFVGWGDQDAPREVREAAQLTLADLATIGTYESIQAAIRATTPDRFRRAREILRHQRRIRDGPFFEALEESPDVRAAFITAIGRSEAFADKELGDVSEILSLLVIMHYELLARRTE